MVTDLDHPHGGGKIENGSRAFRSPLPAGTTRPVLGPAADWPETLQNLSLTIASFAYPVAIYYRQDLNLLHNHAWAEVAGKSQQGQKQLGRLDPDAWDALNAAFLGGRPKKVSAKQLMGDVSPDNATASAYSPVLLSPVFATEGEGDGEEVIGVMAQLIPQDSYKDPATGASEPQPRGSVDDASKSSSQTPHQLDVSQLGSVVDELPLDEHPFFHRFAEMLPSGLAILDHRAQAVFVNQLFYQLTTHHDEDKAFKSWPQSIHPEDYERVMNAYQDAFTSQKQLRTEFRAVASSNPWRLLLLTPLGDENLRHVSLREYGGFICSIVDISSEKSAELSERKAAQEARERKEQQERFIDMISHEIRNPLSAILHCTEDIADATKESKSNIDLDAIHEAVETIELCISHQRNIVDDVLSFSKLDASMLSLDPKSCRPSDKLAVSLKMFQPEFRKQSIDFSYCIDTSYVENGIDFVMADMARIGQVLINLVSNAIKFTAKKESEKSVTISVGASRERPTSYPPDVVYFNSDDLAFRMDATNGAGWGNGEVSYVMVSVKDTGIGISEEGQMRLFERFRQATPKTAELYGGSGLGLNISRKMCHLHGGEIGVSSKKGCGSTFGFFFKVKKPQESDEEAGEQTDDDAAVESGKMKAQIKALGNATVSDKEDEQNAPHSIKSPPVVNADNATPHTDGSKDDRFRRTAAVACKVEEPPADEYANSARPKISPQHRSGEHMRSFQLRQQVTGGNSADTAADESVPRQHVLLVEDNIINQRIVFRKLDTKGFNVTTANNGREAVDAVRAAPSPSSGDKAAFAIVLMDQEMPVLDGNSATREIRALEAEGQMERVPIVGISANVRGAQLQEMLDAGMDNVISKPYKIEDLVEMIGRVTGGGGEGGGGAAGKKED